jgi:capsular polysaccharide transport system permease protein
MLQALTRREKGRSLIGRLRQLPVRSFVPSGTIDLAARSRFRLGLFGWSFVICVLLPTVVSALYFAFIESDEYTSEAHFTIRTAADNQSSALNSALNSISSSGGSSSIGMSGSSSGDQSSDQDVYIVADYIRSRSIIQDIGGKSVLFAIYSRPNIDWLSRLTPDVPLEEAWEYWKAKIDAIVDTPSETITLDVRAFTPQEAQQLAKLILKKSEALVNDISERSRHDAMMRAEDEVKRAEDRLRKARLALLEFRNKENIINPLLSAQSINDTITKLTQDKLLLENNRAALGSSSAPNSPMQRVYATQIATIDQQIDKLRDQLTSQSKDTTLSSKITGYENLTIEQQFAEKLYSIAQASAEKARQEQERQQLYLVTVDRPSFPDEPTYPKILVDSFTMFAGCLILWSMVTLLIASVRDHMGG